MMTDLCARLSPVCACARRICGRLSPPSARPPMRRKSRRENPSQNFPREGPWMVSMGWVVAVAGLSEYHGWGKFLADVMVGGAGIIPGGALDPSAACGDPPPASTQRATIRSPGSARGRNPNVRGGSPQTALRPSAPTGTPPNDDTPFPLPAAAYHPAPRCAPRVASARTRGTPTPSAQRGLSPRRGRARRRGRGLFGNGGGRVRRRAGCAGGRRRRD